MSWWRNVYLSPFFILRKVIILSKKVNLESVRLLFKEFGCELISETYVNAKSKLIFRCKCDEIDNTTYDSFKNREHKMCKKCAKKISSSRKMYSFDFVKETFEENNCILLSNSYKGNNKKLEYICECGTKSEITFASFLEGCRCEKCWYRKVSDKNKLDYEYVKFFFEDNCCVLLEAKYNNAKTKMRYICSCERESEITFANFQNGQRCFDCGVTKSSNKNRRSHMEIKKIFEEENCLLITENYINTKQKLDYICSCGNKHSATLTTFLEGGRCSECTLNKLRFSYEYVKNYFEDNGCILLTEEYTRSDQNLDYICACGRLSKTQFYRFKNGQRCMKCRDEKYNIGENSHSWNGGITNISNYVRGKMSDWKKETEIVCDYRCVITGEDIYDVHHLFGFSYLFKQALEMTKLDVRQSIADYSKYELELLVKETQKLHIQYGTGICIAENLHYEFHSKYGFSNNNPNQFMEFVFTYYPEAVSKVKCLLQSVVYQS